MSELFKGWNKDPLAAYIAMPDFKFDDLKHTMFPDYTSYIMLDRHLDHLAHEILPPVFVCLKSHIDSLYIPRIDENYTNNIIPRDLPQVIASNIDRVCVDFNIVQKTFLYWVYLTECGKAAQTDYQQRIRDRHSAAERERLSKLPDAKGVSGSEDPEEIDIKTSLGAADPFDVKKPGRQQQN